MSNVDWRIDGRAIATCNCAWGCPCQFNALPTTGQCEAAWAMSIDQGYLENTRLDGVRWGVLFWWPGAVHEGNGKQQIFYDEGMSAEQRRALERIARGEVSAEGTHFQIFSAVAPNFLPPVTAPVDLQWDMDARLGRLSVPDLIDAQFEPIRNPITGNAHRANVVLPGGFEYVSAEYASGDTRTQRNAAIDLDLTGTHAHFYRAAWDANGVVTGERPTTPHVVAPSA